MAKLERWHTECVRHLSRSASHVKHTINRQASQMCGTHSFDSVLRLRLRWWRRVLKNDNTTIRTILFGKWSFEDAHTARPMESDRAKLLLRTSKLCCEAFQSQRKTPQRQPSRNARRTAHCTWDGCNGWWKALHVEPSAIESQVCGNVFHGVRGPTIRTFEQHNEQKDFVATDACTCVCGHTLSTERNLRHHALWVLRSHDCHGSRTLSIISKRCIMQTSPFTCSLSLAFMTWAVSMDLVHLVALHSCWYVWSASCCAFFFFF